MAFKPAKKSGYENQKWDKESQPVIEGTYVEKLESVGGKPGADIYVLENDEGKWAVWSSKMLDDFFDNIEIGSKVRVEFLGQVQSKSGPGKYNNFDVQVDDGE